MKLTLLKTFTIGTRSFFTAIISFLLTAVLVLPILGGVASITGIGKLLLFISLFFLAAALAILIITVRRTRKTGRKVVPALLRYWLLLLILSVGVNLIFNLAEDINLNAAKRELRAAGIPLTLKEIIPPLVPAEKNAAPTFQKAFILEKELAKKYEQEWESLLNMYSPRPRAKTSFKSPKGLRPKGLRGQSKDVVQIKDITAAQAAKLVLDNPDFQNLYKLIDQAVSFPSCRFDINYEYAQWGFSPGPDHLLQLRDLSRLTAARTYLLAETARQREALESARTGLRLGDCSKSDPLLSSVLVQNTMDNIGMSALNDLLNRVPELCSAKNYQVLIQELEGKNINAEMKTGMKNNIFLYGYSVFNCILQGRLPPIPDFDWDVKPEEFRWPRYTCWITNPFSKHDFAFYLRTMKRGVEEIDKPYYQTKYFYSRLEKELIAESKAMHYPLSMVFIEPVFGGYNNIVHYTMGGGSVMIRHAESLSKLDGLKIALALRIYKAQNGRYPDKLSALVPGILPVLPLDPFTGKDFIYRKQGTGIIVYSVGENLVDDNGRKDFETKPPSDDIAWEVK